jgi:hypothetical protein
MHTPLQITDCRDEGGVLSHRLIKAGDWHAQTVGTGGVESRAWHATLCQYTVQTRKQNVIHFETSETSEHTHLLGRTAAHGAPGHQPSFLFFIWEFCKPTAFQHILPWRRENNVQFYNAILHILPWRRENNVQFYNAILHVLS